MTLMKIIAFQIECTMANVPQGGVNNAKRMTSSTPTDTEKQFNMEYY